MKSLILLLSLLFISFANAKENLVPIHGLIRNMVNGIATIEDKQVATDVKLDKLKSKDQKLVKDELGTGKLVTIKVPVEAIVAQRKK